MSVALFHPPPTSGLIKQIFQRQNEGVDLLSSISL